MRWIRSVIKEISQQNVKDILASYKDTQDHGKQTLLLMAGGNKQLDSTIAITDYKLLISDAFSQSLNLISLRRYCLTS